MCQIVFCESDKISAPPTNDRNRILEYILSREVHVCYGTDLEGGTKYCYQWTPLLRYSCTFCLAPARELELWLSMPELGEKGRNYLFKSYTDLE